MEICSWKRWQEYDLARSRQSGCLGKVCDAQNIQQGRTLPVARRRAVQNDAGDAIVKRGLALDMCYAPRQNSRSRAIVSEDCDYCISQP